MVRYQKLSIIRIAINVPSHDEVPPDSYGNQDLNVCHHKIITLDRATGAMIMN
jgi:hypothetical protein